MPPRLKDAAVLAAASLSAPCSPTTEPAIGCDLALRSGAAIWLADIGFGRMPGYGSTTPAGSRTPILTGFASDRRADRKATVKADPG
jgi:hypothetical protein